MKKHINLLVFLFISFAASSQNADSLYMREHYEMKEYNVPMRDGIHLYTIVYTPKDKNLSYPFLINRTCYNASTYSNYKTFHSPSPYLVRDKYILVYQDVRGRYQSEGEFTTLTPNIPGNKVNNKKNIDESSDTYDTIEWLLKNISNHNGKAGIYGISYPGFYAAAALPDAHPALLAASPQAPISDFFFDDFHHNGAFLQSYTAAFAVFGYQKDTLTDQPWYIDEIMRFKFKSIQDGYEFNLNLGPLKNITEKYHYDNFFWKELIEHPNYDYFWQERNILPHLNNISTSVMTVGGWFDAEDLYGPLNIYKSLEYNNPGIYNTLVMGPWSHGDWASEKGEQRVNHIYFGDSISTFYQKEIERNFFNWKLKDGPLANLPEAYMFDTGLKEWKKFDMWPSPELAQFTFSFAENGRLLINNTGNEEFYAEYLSDPADPVPYTSEKEGLVFTPRRFMTDDQRKASERPDVLTFQSGILKEDLVLGGEIAAKLKVAMSGTDADFIVKIIDVYPEDHPQDPKNPQIDMGGYQQLVRHEVMRGRFRESFENPKAFIKDEITDVDFVLQDILHTFKKGHRVMIQIHSTWFPYIDRNPQKYVDNIYMADEEDFIKSTIRLYGNSTVEVGGDQNIKIPGINK